MNNFNINPNYNLSRNISPFQTVGSSASSLASLNRGSMLSRLTANNFSISSLLNGAQKTIGTVNQIIPLYNQVKPMFQNSKVLLNVVKSLKGKPNNKPPFSIKRDFQRTNTINQENTSITPKEEIKKDGTKPSKPFFN